jgi:hypothetical protein
MEKHIRQSYPVTNLEVLTRLRERQTETPTPLDGSVNTLVPKEGAKWIQKTVSEYLKNTPCAHQTTQALSEVADKLVQQNKTWKLTRDERVQLINLQPRSILEAHLIANGKLVEDDLHLLVSEILPELGAPPQE